jgi:biotin carboxylase
MAQKKLMLLGGLRYLLPVIRAAHKHGYKVITVDYIPDNIAHKYSDEYYDVSIVDKDAVLELAQKLKIDGIMSFAVDPGVVSAAYVAEKMGLPFAGSYESVCILQDKVRFRRFLTEHGFNVPKAKGYTRLEDALKDTDYFTWPVMVKPSDSAGSKGVMRVDRPEDLKPAVENALNEARNGKFIIEDFLEKAGNSSDTEGFSVNGKLQYCSFDDQLFDNESINPYTPSAYTWPSTIPMTAQKELTSELQRLVTLLHLGTGIYNIETRLCTNGKPYIMEMSPRGGGNRLAEMLEYVTSTPLVDMAVQAAMGERIDNLSMPVYNGFWSELILHSDKDGRFERLDIEPAFRKRHVVEEDLWIEPDTDVENFSGANKAIGTLVLRFDTREEMDRAIKEMDRYVKVVIK